MKIVSHVNTGVLLRGWMKGNFMAGSSVQLYKTWYFILVGAGGVMGEL